jgi:hypothetical protein
MLTNSRIPHSSERVEIRTKKPKNQNNLVFSQNKPKFVKFTPIGLKTNIDLANHGSQENQMLFVKNKSSKQNRRRESRKVFNTRKIVNH